MPTQFHTILFWIYWGITALMGAALARALVKEKERKIQATAAMLLVPVILRLLLVK